MAAPRGVLKNQNLFLAGTSFAGQIEDINLPKLTLLTESFRAGGMAGAVKLSMGMEEMDTDFSVINFNPVLLSKFNVREGAEVAFTVKQAFEDWDGTITQRTVEMRGKVTEKDEGTAKAGEKASLKIGMNLSYMKDTMGGIVVQEIDLINMVHVVDGVDVLAVIRNALGI